MRGTRPLTEEELKKIKDHFQSVIGHEVKDKRNLQTRNYTLFFFTLYTGFRISEVLSIKVKDVLAFGKVSSSVYLEKKNTKGKRRGRTGVINDNCKELLQNYISYYSLDKLSNIDPEKYLFWSRQGQQLKSRQALNIFYEIFEECKLDGKLATHTARKTFSRVVYASLNEDILGLKSALGHSAISSTMSYIEENKQKVNEVLQSLSF